MEKFILILKQMIKFVYCKRIIYPIIIKTMNLYKILIFSAFFLITQITLSQCEGPCEWLYQDLNTESYDCENNTLELFYCENIMETIYAHEIYTEELCEYTTENGQTCQDWDWIGEDIFFSIDSSDPCIDNLTNNTISVKFVGYTDQNNNTSADTCTFDLTFHEFPTPFIDVEDYNTDTQIVLCEENIITLTANGLGTEDIENTNIQWFLNGNIIENGLNMFLFQGQQAFNIWHKVEPEINQELVEYLKN